MNDDEYLTAPEIAKELRVSAVTVQTWCRTGQLVAVRAGRQWRIKRADLEAFLKRMSAPSQDQSQSPKVDGLAVVPARPYMVTLPLTQ